MRSPLRLLRFVSEFLRATPSQLNAWVKERPRQLATFCVGAIVISAGAYGAAMGSWSGGLQSGYTGVKLPLAILLTTLGNGLLNGMVAPLLGAPVTFRQSLALVLVSFAITALILGALSPVALFVIWNTPALSTATHETSPEYGFMQLTIAGFIALAGVMGNVRLFPLLREWTGRPGVALQVLLAWLAGNLFLGSQICWLLRPFIWDPTGRKEFIGSQYLHGSFFETLWEAARRLLFS
jgi:hypothetical protein